ncbi:MAG: hypothetical protein UR68_C0005G0031 [Candidatus Roizmanbacteria bacterium GW2011_GWA2_35_19]|uniref:DUF5659 domain-containing protein n=2 Tax=Candidatus Roizmaniibacteriota TaxID=1752723 RepID=A0A0G0F1L1_9BACT|nr:MAG: hypothetical protein UR63_C0005G0015 [Candidatus Roizmanbacteria bacterium GW2011_GWC2_35_12]KKP73297.1 MAG: hypothetical protein UR68_C0005G0031 [Candidatus Roizmanbacteria bacterium GW2011_GWA2_35_19]
MKTDTIKTSELYTTTDLTTAVTLSLFFPIEAIDKTNPNKAFFLFKRTDNFDQVLETFWRRQLKIEPQAFSAQMKAIKTRLYWEK